jgi:hypothetical protein
VARRKKRADCENAAACRFSNDDLHTWESITHYNLAPTNGADGREFARKSNQAKGAAEEVHRKGIC